ncbi:MAG: glycosyltransferase family 39 protein [Anaerolineae bacterium]|nr:glycosyltransferase family 39 protein [Anaerolineae bacterium]
MSAIDAGATYAQGIPAGAPLRFLIEPWHRWDAAWYIMNAITPYTYQASATFAPLYSILIGIAGRVLGGNYLWAGVLLSSAACLIAFILLYRLVVEEWGDSRLATRTLILLAAFPTAFYLTAVYTEALFLVLVLGVFLAGRRRWWLLAGIAAALATLTRSQGLVLVAPLAWMLFREARMMRQRAVSPSQWATFLLRGGFALGAPVAAWAGFSLFIAGRGLPSIMEASATGWASSFQLPLTSVLAYLQRITQGQVTGAEHEGALALVFACVMGIYAARRFHAEYALYVWASILVFLSLYFEGAQFQSNARHVIVLFPVFVALALWNTGRRPMLLYVFIFGSWQAWMIIRFTNWSWVA